MARITDMTNEQLEAHLNELDAKHQEQQRFSAMIETANYNPDRHRFEIALNNGLEFSVNPDLLQDICTLTPKELANFTIDLHRTDLQWNEQGTGTNVLSILQGRYGSRKWMEKLNAERGIPLGKWADSPYAKEAAARANGKKGGRPRKKKPEDTQKKEAAMQ